MEGIAAVSTSQQVSSGSPQFEWARRQFTAEVASAVKGLTEAGSQEIWVADSHGDCYGNLILEELPPEVKLVTGQHCLRPLGQMEGMDSSFDAAILIGFHAQAGTRDAVQDHTFHLLSLKVNGRGMGELGLCAALAGAFEVPVIFVSGDEAAVREAKTMIPGVQTVAVKKGIGNAVALSLHPQAACSRIYEKVKKAVEGGKGKKRVRPVRFPGKVEMEIQFYSTTDGDLAELVPGTRRLDARTVSYRAKDIREAYRAFRAATLLAAYSHYR